MKGQSKIQSFLESCVNVVVGFGVALLAQVVVFPLFGLRASLSQNIAIGGIFTGVSIIRSYFIRRGFNAFHVWQNKR